MAAGTVPTVMAQGDGLGEGQVQPQRSGDAEGHLGDLERMGQSGALMVVGEHEHLGLAGEATKGGGMQDPVPITLEARAGRIRCLLDQPVACAPPEGGAWPQ